MPRQQYQQTARNTFTKGLLTEFSELSFPNEASIDELNCSLFKAGNRSRRLGVEYEENYVLSSETYTEETLFGTHRWTNVGEKSDTEFLVVQAGSTLRFYQRGEGALSDSEVPTSDSDSSPYIVDLSTYEKASGLGAAASHVEVASINGRLIVVSPQIEAFYIERDTSDNSFSESLIDFKIRDFKYLSDKLDLVEEAATPVSVEREYDTKNCGWVGEKGEDALSDYETANSAYPPLSHPWYSGKNSNGNFDRQEWEKVYSGNTLIVNGHYILDLFEQDRETASGITGVETTILSDRFDAVASYAGRVFFGGVGTRVYFSGILSDINGIGDMYQVNDPTSEEFSDLLDTDGGWIDIPDAAGINKLHVFGSSLLVFARNGVWKISGVDDVFRATEFSIYKVSDEGLAQRRSFVSGENGVPFWWSFTGIHTIQVTDQGGMVAVNLSRDTIQTFWDDISPKEFVQGEYDGRNDRVVWLYSNDGEETDFKLNRILFLDVTLGAFYPWAISDKEEDTPYILGTSFFDEAGTDLTDYNVVDSNGDQVQDSLGNDVIVSLESGVLTSSDVKFLTRDSTGAITFSTFSSLTFLDWGEADYSSFADAAYNFLGDLGRRKNTPYVTVFLRSMETAWVLQGDGAYLYDRPSSLKVSTFWDFKKVASSDKQEAYRFKQPVVVNPSDLTATSIPTTVITTRLKTRGRGRVVRVRFESTTGKDFNLLGWETLGAVNSTY